MNRRRLDGALPRKFMQGMVTSKRFLTAIAGDIDYSLLEGRPFQMIAKWCVEYFQTYGEAPGKAIEPIYYKWAEDQDSPTESDSIRKLLGGLSSEYEKGDDINVAYLLDEYGNYITKMRIDRLKEELEAHLFRGHIDEAVLGINEFRQSAVGRGSGMEPLSDDEVWKRAFTEGFEPLIEFPGDAGRFFNSALTRESLIAIQGSEKRGKTWWCIEFLMRALYQRRKVAFFQVGDLTEGQVLRRLAVRMSGRPMWQRQCGDIEIPKRISFEPEGEKLPVIEMKTKPRACPVPISVESALEATKKILRRGGLSAADTHLMVSVHPTGTAKVSDLDAVLTQWEVEKEFVPDVIIVDYADILAPDDTQKQVRDQINSIWAALRRLSQERRALVIVPTQADASSYSTSLLTMKNFSEDHRKMAHVTGMLGLNQTAYEKDIGLMRLNWIVLRESPFSTSQCLYVAQCLALGRVMCCTHLEGFRKQK